MPRSARPAVTLALLLGAATGCNTWYNDVPSPDNLLAQVPWFDHMIASRAVFPYSAIGIPRNTPPGTVPVTGGEADWSAEWAVANTTTADRLKNPTERRADGPRRHALPHLLRACATAWPAPATARSARGSPPARC